MSVLAHVCARACTFPPSQTRSLPFHFDGASGGLMRAAPVHGLHGHSIGAQGTSKVALVACSRRAHQPHTSGHSTSVCTLTVGCKANMPTLPFLQIHTRACALRLRADAEHPHPPPSRLGTPNGVANGNHQAPTPDGNRASPSGGLRQKLVKRLNLRFKVRAGADPCVRVRHFVLCCSSCVSLCLPLSCVYHVLVCVCMRTLESYVWRMRLQASVA